MSEREAQREFDDLLHSELWQLPRHAMGVSFPHGDLASWRLTGNLERFYELVCALDPEVEEGGKFGWWPGIIGSW